MRNLTSSGGFELENPSLYPLPFRKKERGSSRGLVGCRRVEGWLVREGFHSMRNLTSSGVFGLRIPLPTLSLFGKRRGVLVGGWQDLLQGRWEASGLHTIKD